MWADFAEIRSWRETSTAADFGEIGPHFWHHSLFLSDTGPLRADETTLARTTPAFGHTPLASRTASLLRAGVVSLTVLGRCCWIL